MNDGVENLADKAALHADDMPSYLFLFTTWFLLEFDDGGFDGLLSVLLPLADLLISSLRTLGVLGGG